MLRGEPSAGLKALGIALAAAVGAAAAFLVLSGNPGHMGICGACFLRDAAGAFGLLKGPAYLRPEVAGLILGAFLWVLARGRFAARSGSHAAGRFAMGLTMGIAAMVFLACPFRTLQRLGGGDANAWLALPGLLAGVGAAVLLERRGYHVGKTAPVAWPVGMLAPLAAVIALGLFWKGGVLAGPGPGEAGKPPHALWTVSLSVALAIGAAFSASGFCVISAVRQVFNPGKAMLLAALALIAGYAAALGLGGKLQPGFAQPLVHGDWLWNALALALLGLTGALAGGCPVRQMVMAGEGNGDAAVTAFGILAGGTLAHNLGMVSVPSGPDVLGGATHYGKIAVCAGLLFWLAYGFFVARAHGAAGASARPSAVAQV